MQSQAHPDVSRLEGSLALAHDSRLFDGHLRHFEMYVRGLETSGVHPRVLTCLDPSLRQEYPNWGTVVEGRRIPGGGRLEMGFNRLFPVFSRQLASVPCRILHVNDVYLASATRFRKGVVVSVADLAKSYTRIYPRIPSWIHNRNLPYVRMAEAVVCHSAFVREEVRTHAGVEEARIHTVPLFSLLAPSGSVPRTLPGPPTPAVPWNLLYVATDRPHKNIRLFLEILARLGSRFRGTLVSQLTPATTRLIAQLSLSSRLTVRSSLPGMVETYAGADVLVFPSLYEGVGLPILEAMAFGVPVIAGTHAAVPETVGNGGQLLQTEDVQAWCEAVERLIDPGGYQHWSDRALARSREFNPERTGTALLQAYKSVG